MYSIVPPPAAFLQDKVCQREKAKARRSEMRSCGTTLILCILVCLASSLAISPQSMAGTQAFHASFRVMQ